MAKRISIMGSTGSIGTQTLQVVDSHPQLFQVEALAAGSNVPLLLEQIHRYKPSKVSVATAALADQVRREAPAHVQVYYGDEGLEETAANTDADFVVAALMGSVGLQSTLSAIRAGKTIGLANKETLISAGHIVTSEARRRNVPLIPIDSEHSAIYQCLRHDRREQVSKITLTASGGSFRHLSREELHHVTVEQALKHPNWSMGAKITIDSATMVNKGLEVMEAHWLFDMPYEQIEVLLHPESIIHSMVEFADTSVIAQLGTPDMRVPIQYALSYPERLPSQAKPLQLAEVGKLHFSVLDMQRYPCLKLAYEAGQAGGTAPTVYNAANEVAVARFLSGSIPFLHIETIIEQVLQQHEVAARPVLEQIMESDLWAREAAARLIR